MKKQEIFRGVATALITPFKNDKIDIDALERLLEMQISAGIDAIVIGGTTGEAATLSNDERYELYRESARIVGGRCKLIFGTGTNDTRVAVNHTKYAESVGCDAVLLVTPYYNKGTREGIIRHYLTIADSSETPVILYNVPSRTGVNLDFEMLESLSNHERIVAIKEASDSIDRLTAIASLGESLRLYSGNDSQIYPTLALGGLGVISVVSNLFPKQTLDICRLYFEGERKKSLELQTRMLPVISSLFLETNPAPIKYAMSRAGLCSADMRLPMWLPTDITRRKINEAIEKFKG
jgi:4-hydroxy-tetrahydrodipicolinate synthase